MQASPTGDKQTADAPRRVASSPFAVVPHWIVEALAESRSGHRHLWVYVHLRVMAWQREVERDVAALMDATGLSQASVYDSLGVFLRLGALVDRTDNAGGRWWWLPTDPPDEALSTSVETSTSPETLSSSVESTTPTEGELTLPYSEAIDELASHLADRIAGYVGSRPKITARWRKDLDLLLRRGPLHVDAPEPLEPARVRTAIDFVFDQLAEPDGRSGFCWAAQVRSPHALRDHWLQLRDAAKRASVARLGRAGVAIERVTAGAPALGRGSVQASKALDGEPLGELFQPQGGPRP